MSFPFYTGSGSRPPDRQWPVQLPQSRRQQLARPEKYMPDPGLVDAANVSLLLNQPLLLTGEAGTGKTLFASSLAWELGLPMLKYETKSNSSAQELFYIYDAIKRFQDAQSGVSANDALPYITYRALGQAILYTRKPEEIAPYMPPGFKHLGRTRSVVLIDEVDKAPRDFPNDILNEIEQMYFRIPELGNVMIRADFELYPVVVITSNSEKDLPDAFLRRCIYYNIPFPERDRLAQIVANRLGLFSAGSGPFVEAALDLFFILRDRSSGLRKNPATAELLGWMLSLREMAPGQENPLAQPELALRTLSNLVKTADDQRRAYEIVRQWVAKRSPQA